MISKKSCLLRNDRKGNILWQKMNTSKSIYVILKELYEHLKDGTVCPVEDIAPQRFQISESYWLSIVADLVERGYIKGLAIRKMKTGITVTNLEEMKITYEA